MMQSKSYKALAESAQCLFYIRAGQFLYVPKRNQIGSKETLFKNTAYFSSR